MRDRAGGELGRYPVRTYQTAEAGTDVRTVNAHVPLADDAVEVSLLYLGRPLALCDLSTGAAVEAEPASVEDHEGIMALRWDAADRPALVRYTTDAGATWTAVALDALGGYVDVEGVPIPQGAVFRTIVSEVCRPAR